MAVERTDEELLRAFVAGRRPALAELARRYERPLLGFTRGLLGGRNDLACDAVQETWVRVIRFAGSFDGRSRFMTWLYRIAMNECRNQLAARQAAAMADPPEEEVSADDGPAQAADFQQRVRGAIQQLPSEKRAVLLLCYHGGMTHEQAAEILEIPLGTLKSRLHAAEVRYSLTPATRQGDNAGRTLLWRSTRIAVRRKSVAQPPPAVFAKVWHSRPRLCSGGRQAHVPRCRGLVRRIDRGKLLWPTTSSVR